MRSEMLRTDQRGIVPEYQVKPSTLLKDAVIFTAKAGVIFWGLKTISTTATLDDFLCSLFKVNKGRAQSLLNAFNHHVADEDTAIQTVAPLSKRQSDALARKVGNGALISSADNKLHRTILLTMERAAGDMRAEDKKNAKGKKAGS